jgi:predicted nucleic acid-binding protein
VVRTPRLSARDAIHVAIMQGRDIGRIMSFDPAFDVVTGIERIG